MEFTENSVPNQPTMAEQVKLNGSASAASVQSVTKRFDRLDIKSIC